MSTFIEFLPIVIFYIGYLIKDIYFATSLLILAMIGVCIFAYLREKKIKPMLLVSTLLVLILGGVTIFLRDPNFIMWKPTIISTLFGCVFIGSIYLTSQTLIEKLFSTQFKVEKKQWNHMTWMWGLHFFAYAYANYYVFENFSENFWVNFKLFGSLTWTLLFVIIQSIWISYKGEFIGSESSN